MAELIVNSCGSQSLFDRDRRKTRERSDYTLMYIAQGAAAFYTEQGEKAVHAGEAMLFLPGVRQDYQFLAADHCVNKWIHFDGTLCARLNGEKARVVRPAEQFERHLDDLIRAFYSTLPERTLLCRGYMTVILAFLLQQEQEKQADFRMNRVLNYIHQHICESIDWNVCAELCYLSRDRFNHAFKESTGFAPNEYRLRLQMDHAKQLLCDAGMTTAACAEALGYEDVNYFCRVFHKVVGCSPSQFKAGKTKD